MAQVVINAVELGMDRVTADSALRHARAADLHGNAVDVAYGALTWPMLY